MSRDNQRHARRDLDLQQSILARLSAADEPTDQAGLTAPPAGDDAAWQIDDLIKRGYIRQPGDNDDPILQLTPAGLEAARGGLRAGAAERRTLLDDEELQDLHRLMWESAADDSGDRRRHASGIKWLLEDHFAMRIKDREGGKARPDALGRLEAAGAIERLGGGKSQRTPVCWVYAPVSDPEGRSLRALLRDRISEDTAPTPATGSR